MSLPSWYRLGVFSMVDIDRAILSEEIEVSKDFLTAAIAIVFFGV